ncbi:hypothetical protein F2Q68_00008487 [Brassica cretica]|uniref:Transmembrane protein n=1 Tax=Brassica cretica TaxID=69181 RepID=A0A8S9KS18_BRACR|nr:hypothetical protein F2Q68_00008487 [Brassica cretica]
MFILKLQHYGGIKLSFSEPPNCQIVNGTKQKNRKRNHRSGMQIRAAYKARHHKRNRKQKLILAVIATLSGYLASLAAQLRMSN